MSVSSERKGCHERATDCPAWFDACSLFVRFTDGAGVQVVLMVALWIYSKIRARNTYEFVLWRVGSKTEIVDFIDVQIALLVAIEIEVQIDVQ